MRVRDLCSKGVLSCAPETDLAAIISLMWEFDLGSLPVLDRDGKIVGMITDRDIAVAVGTRNRRPSDLRASEAMSPQVHSCAPDDDVRSAMNTMWTRKIRRLPVVDDRGRVAGILSVNDLILKTPTDPGDDSGLGREEVLLTLRGICSPHRPRASATPSRDASKAGRAR